MYIKGDSMKKLFILILTSALFICLTGCGGNVRYVKIQNWETSQIYSDKDIEDAIKVIIKEFDSSWKGCTLTEITYAGDEKTLAHQEWASRHNTDEAIVLISSFDVDSSGGNGSLNPNSTYTRWTWILVRNKNGRWKHVDHGY